jgi:acetyl/propionyl-CoA carboxylase alpha subunit/acetyl-CoA carboxylase carboxyltransferase component
VTTRMTSSIDVDETGGFRRLAIVNRGEAAMRLLHSVREHNASGRAIIETVALHTTEERTATFVRAANLAVDIGSAAAAPYLDHAVLTRALTGCGADAAWVGWGFVAEDPAFAELCESLGVTFIGPPADAMRRLGDKVQAKKLAESVGVPVAAWSGGPATDVDAAVAWAGSIGYPVLLKAAAGGGGRGIRAVHSEHELREHLARARQEALRSFGDDTIFCERQIGSSRHVEAQIAADAHGQVWVIGLRDCTIQRRHQKVIEESASAVLRPDEQGRIAAAARRLVAASGYRGVGTVEFLFCPDSREFFFLEVNPRLQVEHTVTEMVTGVDFVRLQLDLALGERLPSQMPEARGHAVQARLNAEDPEQDFAPAPGRIALWLAPGGPGIRVDTGVTQGESISPDFDSMIAKIIAHGPDRETALARLRKALADTVVVIEGGTTNKSLLLQLLDRPEVRGATADTGWVDRQQAAGALCDRRGAAVALLAAAIEHFQRDEASARSAFLDHLRRGAPRARLDATDPFDLRLGSTSCRVTVARLSSRGFRITVPGHLVDGRGPDAAALVDIEPLDDHRMRLHVGDATHDVVRTWGSSAILVEVDGVAHRVLTDDDGAVRAPSPAMVVATPVAVGATVEPGTALAVLESMKMETVVRSTVRAKVREVLAGPGDQVSAGQALMVLEPVDQGVHHGSPQVEPLRLVGRGERGVADVGSGIDEGGSARARQQLEQLRAHALGYDVPRSAGLRVLDDYLATAERSTEAEIDLMEIFADLYDLYVPGRVSRVLARAGDDSSGSRLDHVERPRWYLRLRAVLDARPGAERDGDELLSRLLAHYGVGCPAGQGPTLDDAIFRIALARKALTDDEGVAHRLLQGWSGEAPPRWELAGRTESVLRRLSRSTAVHSPSLTALAMTVRHTWFTANTPAPEVEGSGNLENDGDAPTAERLLEATVRRLYYDCALGEVTVTIQPGGVPVLCAEFDPGDGGSAATSLIAVAGALQEPDAACEALVRAGSKSAHRALVADLFLNAHRVPAERLGGLVDVALSRLRAYLDPARLGRPVSRVTLTSVGADGEPQCHTLTGDREGEGLRLQPGRLGLHPEAARQLGINRLADYEQTRLPAAPGIVLLRCVARDNAEDQRLIAMSVLHALTMVRDQSGRATKLPEAELVISGCVDAIRRARQQLGRTPQRLDMNHVWLHVVPELDLADDEILPLARRMAPLTIGSGVEEVLAHIARTQPDGRVARETLRVAYQPGTGLVVTTQPPPRSPLRPLDHYAQKVLRARRRDAVYPYELLWLAVGEQGSWTELDLAPDAPGSVDGRPFTVRQWSGTDRLVAVDREPSGNTAGIVVAEVRTPTDRYPEGMLRIALAGDPTLSLGAVGEAECRRICAALDLAESLQVPVEWFALSSGARISMTSGTENMDWVAATLRRIITFTQRGGEINIIVAGITVGAQPYWNAEATMLMHTKGILIMTPKSAMVLTGKRSLDYSGGVSAEDNFGIGGYERVMGPNGQAQHWAADLAGACEILHQHYAFAYRAPGERFPRPAPTCDQRSRDVRPSRHEGPEGGFHTIGDIFSPDHNPERKKPFDIRSLMCAVADTDHAVMERWAGLAGGETSVVADAFLGGHSVCLVGFESRPLPRPAGSSPDGPDVWTAGTLFPLSAKKTARAINTASGSRPLVVLANLSGFDGSPESMRELQLEYGAEIGRAVVNFDGPIVFCVISRYHGGAFVVFSRALHDNMQVLAVAGARASVIGGAPAAAVVFGTEVRDRVTNDPRVVELAERLAVAGEDDRPRLRLLLAETEAYVKREKLTELAEKFDSVHSIERALQVGSVDEIIEPAHLRPQLIEAVERGVLRASERAREPLGHNHPGWVSHRAADSPPVPVCSPAAVSSATPSAYLASAAAAPCCSPAVASRRFP